MDNLERMNKFLEKYKLPNLNLEVTENLNRPIKTMEIKVIIRNLPRKKKKKKAQDQKASQVNSTQNSEES